MRLSESSAEGEIFFLHSSTLLCALERPARRMMQLALWPHLSRLLDELEPCASFHDIAGRWRVGMDGVYARQRCSLTDDAPVDKEDQEGQEGP